MGGPKKAIVVAAAMIELPGIKPVASEISYIEGEQPPKLDDIAIQLHGAVNDIVMSIRANKLVVDGQVLGE